MAPLATAPGVNHLNAHRPRSSGGRRPRSARAQLPPKVGTAVDTELSDGNDEVRAAVGAAAVIHPPGPPAAAPAPPMSPVPLGPFLPNPVAPLVPAAPHSSGRGRSGPRAARLQAALASPASTGRAREFSSPRGGTPSASVHDLFASDTIETARPRSSGGRGVGALEDGQTPLFGSPVELLQPAATAEQNGENTASNQPLLAGWSPVTPQGVSQRGSPWNTSATADEAASQLPARPRSCGGTAALPAGEEYEDTLDQLESLLDDLDAGILPDAEDLEVIDDVLTLTRARRLSRTDDVASAAKRGQTENQASKTKEKKDKKKRRKRKKKEKQHAASPRQGTSVRAAGAEVHQSGLRGDNWEEEGALHVAAAKGDAYMLNMIIGDRLVAGKTPQEAMDSTDGNDWTALHYAVQHGGTKGVQALLDAGCSIDVADASGWTPLMEAAWNGHADALALILRKLAPEVFRPVSRGASMSPATALLSSPHVQPQNGAKPSARLSTAVMLSVDAQDKDGWTALHAAAYASDSRCVALLLRAGAESQVVDGAGQSPADVAQAQGAGKIAGVLRGELSNDVLEASGLLENRMNNSHNGTNAGGRSSKDGKFRSPSPGVSGRGNGSDKHSGDVESGLLAGDAFVDSSDSSDDDILDPLGAISRTGRA